MPASPDNRRLVTYVPVAHADGRTVSGGLARVIADALGDLVDQVARLPVAHAAPGRRSRHRRPGLRSCQLPHRPQEHRHHAGFEDRIG